MPHSATPSPKQTARFKRAGQLLAAGRLLILAKGIKWAYKKAGVHFLTKEQTVSFLEPCQLVTHPATTLPLPKITDLAQPARTYFEPVIAETEPVSVWRCDVSEQRAKLLPYGAIITQQQLLCTDANTDDFFRNVIFRPKRSTRRTSVLIAPWSHYLDGFMWGGYYDYVLLVAGKLCRIKDVLSEAVFKKALVAYPLFDTSYEREYLSLLGIESNQLVDSRKTTVSFDQCIVANAGHWFYPNKADVAALRKYVLAGRPPAGGQRNRIYISRSGRRRILNEGDVILLLKAYNFQVIEDIPRSVTEQVTIFQNADFIIGPHGASFTNILWCQPGAHLFELFSPTYTPAFFRYLAELLGLRYSAYHHGVTPTDNWAKGLEDDMYISISELKQCLDTLF